MTAHKPSSGGSSPYIGLFIQGSGVTFTLGGPFPAIDTNPANASTVIYPTITIGAGLGFGVRVINKSAVSIVADLQFGVHAPDGTNKIGRSSDTLTFAPNDDVSIDFPYANGSTVGTDLSWDTGTKEILSTAGGQFTAFAIIQPSLL